MKTIFSSIALSALLVGAAGAATIDFTAATFSDDTVSTASATIDGVTFTFTATAKGTDRFVQGTFGQGLAFGVPGNGMNTLSIVADADVTFDTVTGFGHALYAYSPQLDFDFSVDGAAPSASGSFSYAGVSGTINLNSISVDAGESFLIEADVSSLGSAAVYASGFLSSIDFTVVPPATTPTPSPSAVPLPAGMPLLFGGLAGFVALRRRKS